MVNQSEFDTALKKARLAEAAQLDAVLNVKDARSLRLLALRDAVLPALVDHPAAVGLTDLVIQPGETPRLWLDLISSVVIAPDTRIYRLEQERNSAREVLYETDDLEDMKANVLRYLAHRVIAREKSAAGLSEYAPGSKGPRYGAAALAYVWITGALTGVLILLLAAILLGILNF